MAPGIQHLRLYLNLTNRGMTDQVGLRCPEEDSYRVRHGCGRNRGRTGGVALDTVVPCTEHGIPSSGWARVPQVQRGRGEAEGSAITGAREAGPRRGTLGTQLDPSVRTVLTVLVASAGPRRGTHVASTPEPAVLVPGQPKPRVRMIG